ncbi:MAG: hypothetical protein V4543_09660 [Bacteroidota bacterium]
MKKIIFSILFILLLVLLCINCVVTNFGFISSGTIGSIEMYKFNVPENKLKNAVNIVLKTHSEMVKPESMYNLNGTGYENVFHYCIISDGKTKYILEFNFIGDTVDGIISSEIGLTSANVLGKDLPFAKEIGILDSWKYARIFNKKFISKIRLEIENEDNSIKNDSKVNR